MVRQLIRRRRSIAAAALASWAAAQRLPGRYMPSRYFDGWKSGHQYGRSTNRGIPQRLIVGREIQKLGIAGAPHLGQCLFLFDHKTLPKCWPFYPDK